MSRVVANRAKTLVHRFCRRFHSSGHECHGVRHGDGFWVDDAQAFAQPVDVDAVGDFEDVGHIVGDKDDGDAAGFDVGD